MTVGRVALVLSAVPAALAAQAAPDSAVRLPPVEITVTRAAQAAASAPFAVTVLSAPDLVAADPGLSLSAALAGVPGVASQNRYSLARDESLVIRGFGARSAFGIRGVRILLDGVPQTLPDGQGQLTNVDLRRVHRAEVLRGATSVLHGNAAGGVVSLVTDYATPRRVLPDVRALAGGDDLVVLDAGVAAPLGAGTLLLDASRHAGGGHRAQNQFEIFRAGARAAGPLGAATRMIAVAHAARMPEAQDPGALTAAELAADPTQANPAFAAVNAAKTVTQTQAGVTLEHAPGDARLGVTAFGLRRELDQRLPFATILLDRWAWGARVEGAVPLDGAARPELVAGVDAQWQRDDRRNLSPADGSVTRDQLETVREVGPFLQLRVQPAPQVSLLAGGRFDAVAFRADDRLLADGDDSGARTLTALSGTLGAAVALSPALGLYGNVGTAFETPTTTELGNRPDGAGGFNPDLAPQRAVQVEVGGRATLGPATLALAAFHAAVRDALIPFEVPTDPGRRYFRNAGRTRHRGVEIESTARLSTAVAVRATYTISDLRFVDFATDDARYDGNRVPGVPLHLGRAALAARRGPAALDLEVRAASGAWGDDANTARVDGWWVADAAASLTIPLGDWMLRPGAGIENLFDRSYVAAIAVNGAGGRYYEPAPGRVLYIGVSAAAR